MVHQRTEPATGAHTALGVDIGGTGMKGGIVQLGAGPEAGGLLGKRFRIPTPQPALPDTVAGVLEQIVAELDSRPGAPPSSLPAGVCFPAAIQNGVCRTATNIDHSWIGTDVDALFSDRLKRPVMTLNDADAAGLAEMRYGAGQGVPGTVLVLTLGTGIGGGLFRDGELVPNLEPGTIELDGDFAERRASAAARERDGLDWPEYAERLQRFFTYMEGIFYPDLIIVGGGISKRPEDYLPLLRLRTPIVPAQLQNNAGIVGAALWATDLVAQTPTKFSVLETARRAGEQEMARIARAEGAESAPATTATTGQKDMTSSRTADAGNPPKKGNKAKNVTKSKKAEKAKKAKKAQSATTAKAAKKGKNSKNSKKDKKTLGDTPAKADATTQPKAERQAAREAQAVHRAMEKAIRRSGR